MGQIELALSRERVLFEWRHREQNDWVESIYVGRWWLSHRKGSQVSKTDDARFGHIKSNHNKTQSKKKKKDFLNTDTKVILSLELCVLFSEYIQV